MAAPALPRRRLRPIAALLAAVSAAAALCSGCSAGTSARLDVERGRLLPGQALTHFTLTTTDAAFARDDDGCRLLLAFPLPGSTVRPRYFLHMSFPAAPERADFAPGRPARAVFVDASRTAAPDQEVCTADGGQLDFATSNRGYRMTGQFDLRLPDGRRLSGTFNAALRPDRIAEFERAYPTPPPDRPADPATPSEPHSPRLDRPLPGRPLDLASRPRL